MKRVAIVSMLLALMIGASLGGTAPAPKPGSTATTTKRAKAAPSPKRGSAAPGYVDSVEAWRARRLARLTSDSGWLTISGLFWLNPGRNILGSDTTNYVVFPKDASPPKAAIIQLEFHPATHAAEMEFIAVPGAEIRRDTTLVTREMLTLDADGSSPVYTLGRLKFWVIQRGLRYAVRVRDPESSVRKSFVGIENYPVDPKMCVEGKFVPNAETTYVLVPNIVGYVDSMLSPGIVTFALGESTLRLTPVLETPTDTSLFFVFQDATSGNETYGGGRFFYADVEKDGHVWLDFNKAYNPPCAFNPNTTCPLPPEGNVLPIPIRAGEMAYKGPPGHVFEPKH